MLVLKDMEKITWHAEASVDYQASGRPAAEIQASATLTTAAVRLCTDRDRRKHDIL